MQNLVEQVISGVSNQNLNVEIEPEHVNRILGTLDETERSVTEISRLAQVPGGTARVILTTMEKLKGSPVTNKHMRFRLSESNKKSESAKKPAKKSISPKDGLAAITSIITILNQRPQTVSSLSDELSIDSETCQKIINKLESENAVSKDLDTEWEEPVYVLDSEGYSAYLERNKNKAKAHAAPEKKAVIEKPVVTKQAKKVVKDNDVDDNIISVEDMVLKVLNSEGKSKISGLVKATDAAITRVDIEEAVKKLEDNGVVESSNPNGKYPFYSLVVSESKKEPKKAEPVKATAKKEVVSQTKPKAEKVSAKKEVVSQTKPVASKPVVKKEVPVQSKTDTKPALSATEATIKPEPVLEAVSYSQYSDIAALQIVLEDILEGVPANKVARVRGAIANIEREKTKVKNAVSNLNKTINELF